MCAVRKHKRIRTLFSRSAFVLTALAGTLVLSTGSATASTRLVVNTFGSFSEPRGMAIDQSNGNVYVADRGTNLIYVFNAAGEPTPAGGLPSELTGAETPAGSFFFYFPPSVAVDSSCFERGLNASECAVTDPSNRDIYVAEYANGVVDKFRVNGSKYEYVCQLEWAGVGVQACVAKAGGGGGTYSVTVDSDGNVYVASIFSNKVYEYNSTGKGVREFTSPNVEKPQGLGVDSAGNLYIEDRFKQSVVEIKRNGAGEPTGEEIEVVAKGAGRIAFDRATNRLIVAFEDGHLSEYDSKGVETGARFGPVLAGGIAVNDEHDEVYVTDESQLNVKVFGGILNLPVVVTGGSSGFTLGGVTLEGTVNPEDLPVSACTFEYGTSLPYTNSVACSELPGPGKVAVPVSGTILEGLESNTLYHYRLSVTAMGATVDGNDATFMMPPAPALVTASVSGVSQFAATLSGTVNPEKSPTSYHFVYGTTASYGSVIPIPDLYTPVNLENDAVVSQRLSGLLAGTTYHYALVATNPGGIAIGPDQTFRTLAIPAPTVGTGVAAGAGVGTVTLTGSIDPHGWDTTYTFQYGASTGYGSVWPTVPVDMGALNGTQPVAIYVQNLLPGATYHYRLLATNGGGTIYGPDMTFTTAEYPAPIVQEPSVLAPIGLSMKTPKAKTKHKPLKHKGKKHGGKQKKGKKKK
jgi:sugar lactone lactonase YvrE